ncbi:ubiquitin-like modifier-activating enzyme 7 [Echinops telfairi]|uniref:Ubiquitin-like modifier-activating enzyme 7 n=1 Tax=Echinops telfairi TaxID=9371 RepID=A0ABM1VM30_ECHTE|nr:ubiquitin-like modifier-activating enzyme 7 [Echinops telfairi]
MDRPEPPTTSSLDEELYSRQLYVLGSAAMVRIQGAKVLLSGLRGLGAEVAKNLVLMGVGSLTLHDPHPTCWSDLTAQFFLSEKDLGTSRAEASREPVAQLNRATQVSVHPGTLTEDLLLEYQVVVLTNSELEEQLRVGQFCHQHGVCFVMADTRGLVGQLFCDFGEDFRVQDPTEAEPLVAAIQNISQGSPGVVTLRGTDVPIFQDEALVTFSGIRGMVELNGCTQTIRVRDTRTLEIGDTTHFSCYLHGGIVTEVKEPKTVSHEALATALHQPRVVAQEAHRAHCLHQVFRALHQFQTSSGHPPRPWHPGDAEAVGRLAQALGPLQGTSEEPLDEALVRAAVLCSAGDLSPMAALLGAVAAQEVLKAVSRTFMPLDQWLYFDALDCLPEDGVLSPEECAPRGCRYDGQTAVFGADFQEKLSHQHYLLVGAGAIGCELLKSFALMGLGASGSGSITVADMDHIERSNLSRQFLFRPEDIGSPKAQVAAEAASRLNPGLHVTPFTHPLDRTTEHIYGDSFFSRVDGVAAALDSFQARRYVAARCTHYLKPMLEAGTLGTMGSTSVSVPHVTEVYKAPTASQDAGNPVCTVRFFPSNVEHTLEWARNEFEGLFRLSAEVINRHQQAPTSLADTEEMQMLTLLQPVRGVLRERPRTWHDCVMWARGHWQLCFHDSIRQLLKCFPPEKVLENGTPFWSGPKQCPQPLEFDANQDMHLLYVLAAANLYAHVHGLCGSKDQTALRELLKLPLPGPQHLAPTWRASDPESAQASTTFDTEQLKELQETLEVWSLGHEPLKPLLFEKDDDSNFHMDFVTAAASLRAQNYGIPPANRAQSKQIVGKIIPAIATTTAAVAGLMGLELYKVVGGLTSLGAFRHSYLHLAENRLNRWVPPAPVPQTFRHLTWTRWDRLKVPAGQPEVTVKSLLASLQERYGLQVSMLLYGPAMLYSVRSSADWQNRTVTELVHQVTGQVPEQQVLVLELSCEGEEEDTAFPPLHYER